MGKVVKTASLTQYTVFEFNHKNISPTEPKAKFKKATKLTDWINRYFKLYAKHKTGFRPVSRVL